MWAEPVPTRVGPGPRRVLPAPDLARVGSRPPRPAPTADQRLIGPGAANIRRLALDQATDGVADALPMHLPRSAPT